MNIMDEIRIRQAKSQVPSDHTVPKHEPEMLYIGCIDARLDPIDDIGIKKGKALIFRNIGALVLKDRRGETTLSDDAINEGGEIPQSVSIGAALEFFLRHLPFKNGQMKHIVISGHTDCGGMKACQHSRSIEQDHYLPLYLKSLAHVRDKVIAEAKTAGWDDEQTLHALEKEAVRQSLSNLLTYPVVQKAIKEGVLEVHGWIINTVTRRISQMNPATKEFEPMT